MGILFLSIPFIKISNASNNTIIKQQSGFRRGRQTRDNIFHLTQKALETVNRGKKMCTIFFDIASAFDKVWHNGLLYKLIQLKFPNHIISWIKEFLENRFFVVRVGDVTTTNFEIKAGVPQGAVLSPKLFAIYINDLPIKYKKNKFYSLLFADDLCAYNIFKRCGNVNKQIQAYLNMIETWLKKWRLMMAPQKCNYIVFSSCKASDTKMNLKLFDAPISACADTTFLGIRFDQQISFKNQISYLKDACVKRMNILKVLSNKSWGLSIETMTTIYNSLIRSLMEYSSIIYPALSKTNMNVLERIQLRCFKIIHRKSKYESNESIKSLPGYESVADRFDKLNLRYLKNKFAYKTEIIVDLFKDYKEYSESRDLKKNTLFCLYKEDLDKF